MPERSGSNVGWWTALTAIGVLVAIWYAHGRPVFSVPASGGAAPTHQSEQFEELFEPTGLHGDLGTVRAMDRRFRLGLLPASSGFGMVSVSTVAPVVIGGAWIWSRRRISSEPRPSDASRRDRPRPPACPPANGR